MPDFKDDYPNNSNKVKDLPAALSGLSSNLKLWLDASDVIAVEKDGSNKVSQWYDWSGNGNHASQANVGNQPALKASAIDSKSTVLFDHSSSDYMKTAAFNTIGDELTIISVFKPGATVGGKIYYHNDSVNNVSFYTSSNSFGAWNWSNGYYGDIVEGQLESSKIYIGNYRYKKQEDAKLNLNGALVGTSTSVAAGITQSSNKEKYIGSHPNPTDFYEGELAELIVISSALDDSQMSEINAYLADKWGLTATVDSDGDSVVDANDSDTVAMYQPNETQVLNEFSVSSNRTLSLTDANGNSQRLDYAAGSFRNPKFLRFRYPS